MKRRAVSLRYRIGVSCISRQLEAMWHTAIHCQPSSLIRTKTAASRRRPHYALLPSVCPRLSCAQLENRKTIRRSNLEQRLLTSGVTSRASLGGPHIVLAWAIRLHAIAPFLFWRIATATDTDAQITVYGTDSIERISWHFVQCWNFGDWVFPTLVLTSLHKIWRGPRTIIRN